MAGVEDSCPDIIVSPETVTSALTSCELDTASTVSGRSATPVKEMVKRRLSLREVWEIYIRLVKSQDQSADNVKRQSQLLDTLLHMCSAALKKGLLPSFRHRQVSGHLKCHLKALALQSFTPENQIEMALVDSMQTSSNDMKSVCNQLCKEFMSDVFHITSRSEEDDVTDLQKYLLTGRGGLLIKVIHSQGVQSLSNRPALANLLGSLLPWCLSFPLCDQEEQCQDPASSDVNLFPLHQCFPVVSQVGNGTQRCKPKTSSQSVSNRLSWQQDVRRSMEMGSRKRFSKRRSSEDKDLTDQTDNDSTDATEGKSSSKVKKKNRGHLRCSMADKPDKGDTDSEDDDIGDVLKSMNFVMKPTTGYELCVLVLDLLCKLCLVDSTETGKSIAPSLLLKVLHSLTWDSDTYTSALSVPSQQMHVFLNRQLLRVTFSLASAIAMQPNGVNILYGNQLIKTVLQLARRTIFFQCSGEIDEKSDSLLDFSQFSDTVFGLLHLLTLIFDRLPFNPNFIKTASALIEDLDIHQGFRMINLCILHCDWLKTQQTDDSQTSDGAEDDPVKMFSTFLSTIKIVRVTYQHSMKCVKRKHHKCSYTHQFDHHHDILGIQDVKGEGLMMSSMSKGQRSLKQGTNGQTGSQLICIISFCTHILLDLLVKVSSKGTRLELVRAIYSSGVCCCMDMNYVISGFKEGIQKFSPAVRTYALDTLNKVVLEHFSGGLKDMKTEDQNVSCSYCDIDAVAVKEQTEKEVTSLKMRLGCKEVKGVDSGIEDSDPCKDAKMAAMVKISRWKPIRELGTLLYSKDEALAASVAKHLMVLAIKGNGYLKAELYYSIYMQALDAVQTQSEEKPASKVSGQLEDMNQNLSKPVQVHCLSALPYLLQANCVIQSFLTTKGVQKLCELLEDSVLRGPVLKIFDALVVLDDKKVSDNGKDLPKDCPCPYSGGLVISSFINELCRRSFDSTDMYIEDTVRTRRIRRDSAVLSKFSLPVLVDLWEACAKMCLHSSGFVTQFVDQQCFRKTEQLLLETVDILTSCGKLGTSLSQTETEDSGQEGDWTLVNSGQEDGSLLLADIDQSDSGSFFMRVSLMESLMVVLGTCHKYTAHKDQQYCQTWNKFKERFVEPVAMETPRLKVFLDAIMKAAMPEFISVLEYSFSRNVAMVYIRDDDIYDEDEVRQLLQSGSDVERETNTSMGYDADSEQSSLSDSEKDNSLRFCLLKTRTTQKVFFPPTFGLLVNVLVAIYRNHSDGDAVVNSMLHKLLQKARVDEHMVKAMCQQNVLTLILNEKGFWTCLINKDSDKGVVDNLLALIELCAQHRLQSCDLEKLLQLFQLSDISMDRLLILFHTVVQNSRLTSHHSIDFPVRPLDPPERPSEDLSGSLTLTKPRSVSPLLKSVTNMFSLGISKNDATDSNSEPAPAQEVWKLSALQTSLGDTLKWPPFQHGFTLTTWLSLNKATEKVLRPNMPLYDLETDVKQETRGGQAMDALVSECLHIVSIGTREKLFEIWADIESGSIVIRLTSEMGTSGLVLRETKLHGIMSLDRWQHLVISYVETLEGSTLTGKANLIVDGWQSHSFILDHPTSSTRYRHRSSSHIQPVLCLGHMTSDTTPDQTVGTWSLGHTMLFKGASVSKETIFHLYTLGPNQSSMLKCDCGSEMTSYAPHLHKDAILHSNLDQDTLVGIKKPVLTELRLSLLLSYTPKRCAEFASFPKMTLVQGSNSYNPDVLLSQQSRPVQPLIQAQLHAEENCSLEKAVNQAGGMAAILFLVAKVYERCPESMPTNEAEKVQAEALKVLMATVQHSSQLEEEYISIGGHALLCKVLTSCRSVVGPLVLKVLMDAATTDPLYKLLPDSAGLTVRPKSDALIRDVSVIEHLILHWQVWEGLAPGLMDQLFSGLASLVREDHPHQAYNIKQYQVINIVNRIFKIYQERIQEGFPALPVSVSQSVVSIIQNLTGAPPDYHLILDICDFLLLVHPAANTYINHSRSSFYFCLPWGLPQSPLTRWKQGLGHGPVTSSPLKGISYTPQDSDTEIASKSKKMFEGQSVLPQLEIVSQRKDLSSCEDLVDAMMEETAAVVPPPAIDIQLDKHRYQTDRTHNANTGIGVDKSSSFEGNDAREERDDNVSDQANDSIDRTMLPADVSTEGLVGLYEAHRIPSGFESLYKENSHDEGDEINVPETDVADVKEVESVSEWSHSDESANSTGTRENLTLNFDEDSIDMLRLEEGLTALCVGLLRLLKSIIVMMPDNLTEKTFQKSILNPEMFIVLAQNSSPQVREAVIKVIEVYLERANRNLLEAFLKVEGFHLLSAQLFLYPTHQEQLEAAVSMVLHRPFYIDEGLHQDEVIEELTQVQQAAVPVMLVLLGNSTGDIALCHNSLQFCCKLFELSDMVATVMVEQAVIEVLCNMIMKLFESGTRSTDVVGMDENEILLTDILEFLKVIAVREFSASGPQHYQQFEDILFILQDMDTRERQLHGLEGRSTQALRVFQQHILMAVTNMVERASEEVSQQSFSLFPRTSSSRSSSSSHNANYEASHPVSSAPSLFAPRHTPLALHPFNLSSNLGHSPFHRKSPGGYFVQPDQPFTESLGRPFSGSGGDSDSSMESWHTSSAQTVNLPVTKHGYSRSRSNDGSHVKLVRSSSIFQTVLSIGKRKKLTTIPVSQNELIDRLKKFITTAVDTAVFSERKLSEVRKVAFLFESPAQSVSMEREFMKKLFNFTYRAFEATLPHEKGLYKRTKNVIMWGAKDSLRVQFGRLLTFMLGEKQDFDQRGHCLSFIMGEPRGLEVVRMVTTTPDLGNELAYNVRDLLVQGKKWMSRQQVEDGSKLLNHLSSAGFNVIPTHRDTATDNADLRERRSSFIEKHDHQKSVWIKKRESALNSRIFYQYNSLSGKLSDNAMEVTQSVTQLQTQERKKFITHIKQRKTESIQVKKQWQEIVQNLTHERAVWYDEKSYPQSWQLNPTEGPYRVRKRLQRGHLGILPRFLRREAQYKLAMETVDPPLIYLFEDDHQISDSPALIYQLHKNKKIRFTFTCRAVSPNSESKGELLIAEDSVFFVADEAVTDANYTQVLLGNKDQLSMTWPFEDIQEVHKRWYELTDTGLEIFLTNGKTCLLALRSAKERDDLYMHLSKLELPNRVGTDNLLDIVDRWQEGSITNFEYLTLLNKLAGRSFNDLMQYPIMPFILRDYTSESIDLRDLSVYRDLSKPVSVQDPKNEFKFMQNYSILKQEYDKYDKNDITGLRVAPYHYGSHYSNSGSVLHFLVRLPPFTKMFLDFQDQSFDIPDRTFHNLHTSWRLSSAESNTDVKELIPEFFYMHEFLRNTEGFDLGCRQSGELVDNVLLPPWCQKNRRLFILIHRQALESDYVSESIGSWIDLVLGIKQRGDLAVRAINVFHPATYFGLDVSSVKSDVDKKAIQTMVRTYGQTPKQLFKIKHPSKHPALLHQETSPKLPSEQLRFKTVFGLKWGSYLGSPDRPDPVVTWEKVFGTQVTQLMAVHNLVFGLSSSSCLLLQQNHDKRVEMSDSGSRLVWAAIVIWGQTDGLLRVINEVNKPPVNFINISQPDEITCCVSVPDCRYLFIGGSSGGITVYNTKYNPAKNSMLQVFGPRRTLYGHKAAVTSLCVCKPYSVLVSGAKDCTCIIWDLNRVSYVRSITGYESSVQAVAISDTLGDIASVCHVGMGSMLYLHTVNAEFVAKTTTSETINCLAYSTASEGVSINVIAGGLSSGVIRLWSSWDLMPVRDLKHTLMSATPIISLTFTKDSQRLYSSSADGRVVRWDYSGRAQQRPHEFRPHLFPTGL